MRWLQSLPILFTVLLFSACGPRDAVVEAPLPTNTPFPTFTSTPVGAAPAASGGQAGSQTQVQPAATPVPPAASATPGQPMVTIGNVLMNVRGGPGTNYHVIGTASPSEKFVITGKNPGLGDWWQIDFRGQTGWVYGPLVTAINASAVQVALVIPAPPPPTATPIPPTLVPAPTQPPAPRFQYSLTNQEHCPRNDKQTFFEGIVYDRNNNFKNGVCLHIAFGGPRNTKCTGCGKPTGRWGFSPFGGRASSGTNVQIFVVNCPNSGWDDPRSRTKDFSNLTPLSDTWTKTISESVGCVDITFQEN